MSEPTPAPWVASGNDYRGVLSRDTAEPPRVAVVVSDDGPNQQLRSAIEGQDFGGEATVTAAKELDRAGDVDFMIFLRPGDIPGPGWLSAHARWHVRASNLVVLGPSGDTSSTGVIRGTRRLLATDEGFAAMTSTNVSVHHQAWPASSRLDVVGGWRLWNEGCFFVYDSEAQLLETSQGTVDILGVPELADLIPHRRYRSTATPLHSVPRVSVLAAVTTPDEATATWEMARRSSFADLEMILFGPAQAMGDFVGLARDNPRVTVIAGDVGTFAEAVKASRGELVAIVDPVAAVSTETLAKAVARFDQRPAAPVIRVGYDFGGGRFLRLDDLAAIDGDMGGDGLPLFAMTTRRELLKDPAALAMPGTAWAGLLERCEQSLVVTPTVSIARTPPIEPGRPGIAEVTAIGAREAAITIVRAARRRRASAGQETGAHGDDDRPDDRVSVAYVGFTGHDNLGDEAVRVAIERLMPWADFRADPPDPQLLMVGGGTLLNGRRYYLNRMLRQESASVEKALFGTGVRSPEYWGVTEPMDEWFSFIDSALFAAVRGPDSVENLRALGYRRDLPVIGDPALSLGPPADVSPVSGRVVVCPVFTDGNLHGGSDDAVFDAIAGLIQRARSEGRDVVMLSAFPKDDRWVIDIMRRAGTPDLEYVAGYADIDDTMRLLASADVVIAERLHAAIMAAAAGTPFVGLEYRPKLRDFARSVDQEAAIIPTDQMGELEGVFDRVTANRESLTAALAVHVDKYRALQVDAAEKLRTDLSIR